MNRKSIFRLVAGTLFLALLLCLGIAVQRAEPAPAPVSSPEPMPALTPEPTPGRRTPSPLAGAVRIAELMEKNRSTVLDEDGEFPDWIELWNASDEAVDLDGWRLADGEDKEGWVLPALTLSPDERLVVFASRKDRRGAALHTDFAVSAEERIVLRDARGLLVDTADCGGCDSDVSMALSDDGAWAPCLWPTPGYANTREGYEELSQTLLPTDALVINEVMISNLGAVVTGLRSDCDWVEIRNVSDEPVLLSEYFLSDKASEPFRLTVPV